MYRLKGLTEYKKAWKWQKALQELIYRSRKEGTPTAHRMLVVEHPSVYTLGRGATLDNVKDLDDHVGANKSPLVRVERGGEVTWHGPGQVVAYPIFDLSAAPLRKDLRWFMHGIEAAVIDTLAKYGVHGGRLSVNNGVWVGTNKVAAVGVTASRWITMHGAALNVDCGMDGYSRIVPCGIQDPTYGVCSLQQVSTSSSSSSSSSSSADVPVVAMGAVASQLVSSFGDVFDLEMNLRTSKDIATESGGGEGEGVEKELEALVAAMGIVEVPTLVRR